MAADMISTTGVVDGKNVVESECHSWTRLVDWRIHRHVTLPSSYAVVWQRETVHVRPVVYQDKVLTRLLIGHLLKDFRILVGM